MKKVISLVLVVALFATLAVFASADVVGHPHGFCQALNDAYNWPLATPGFQAWIVDIARSEVIGCADEVKIVDITEGVKQTWTSCAQAITDEELQAICDNNTYGIANLTVFRQRNIEEAEGAVDITVKLWPCNPDKRPNQATVILFRAEGSTDWTVKAYEASNEASAQFEGNGAYVVALAW